MDDLENLIQASLKGERRATARLISMVEKKDAASADIMKAITPYTGNAYRIGVTGPPGAGKSTTVDRLVGLFCKNNYSVGVIAVDPSSPFSGGALLGDRIRMTMDVSKNEFFFRSMSAGKTTGGLSRTAAETVKILDASGLQIIIIETIGVGQSDLDIAELCDTVLVVLVPESGDTIQVMKSGLMEIADIFSVNKSDRNGAQRLFESIRGMAGRAEQTDEWAPLVYKTAASLNRGIEELYLGIWTHYRYLGKNSRMEIRRKKQLGHELRHCLQEAFLEYFWTEFVKKNDMDFLVQELWENKSDIRFFSENVVKCWLKKETACIYEKRDEKNSDH